MSKAARTQHTPRPAKVAPELLPFLDALAEIVANDVQREMKCPLPSRFTQDAAPHDPRKGKP